MKKSSEEFQEIAHCGGDFTIDVRTSLGGVREVAFGISCMSLGQAAFYAVYAIQPGIPVETIELGGIGQPWNAPPVPGCVPVFMGSDSHGMFGHQCPICNQYWRSRSPSPRWKQTCPYCGLKLKPHETITEKQQRYIEAFCRLYADAVACPEDKKHVLRMDLLATEALKSGPRQPFYYTEEQQQRLYECRHCGAITDIIGRYCYCSLCGTHNSADEVEDAIIELRKRVVQPGSHEACVTESVAAFDSCARQMAKQLASRIPMTPNRKRDWDQKLFHNLPAFADGLRTVFDIHVLRGLTEDEAAFAARMFFRRHVYEHNGGEVDARYIEASGDETVRPKQVIRETRESASRLLDIIVKISRNLSVGFHEIFPPEAEPIRRKRVRGKA
jgi:hypothetical protein